MLVVAPKIDKQSFLEGAGAVGSKCGGICAGSDGRLYCLCRIYVFVLVLLLSLSYSNCLKAASEAANESASRKAANEAANEVAKKNQRANVYLPKHSMLDLKV